MCSGLLQSRAVEIHKLPKAKGDFLCVGAGGAVGIVGVVVRAGGGGGSIVGGVSVGVGALASGVGCS